MRSAFRRLRLLTVSALCLFSLSCAGARYEPLPETGATLEGTVSYGKERVAAALIVVAGETASAQGMVGEDGRYKLTNVPLGEVTIAVNTAAAKGMMMGKAITPSQDRKGKAAVPKIVDVPAKYFDPSKSGIRTTVRKGDNTFDIVVPK